MYLKKWTVAAGLILYSWLVIRTAWVGDDAIITFRSLENFLHGFGPVYNIGERSQTFTHPLWFLTQALANYVFNFWKDNPLGQGQMYFLNIFLSVGISLLTALIFTFNKQSTSKGAALGLLVFSLSKAFVDYSTSGLENPLTHFILLLFILVYLSSEEIPQRRIMLLSALASLGGVDRLDTLLFYFPTLILILWENPERVKTIIAMGVGFIPLIAWEIFSILYYGFPFPNTAYAKINTGISAGALIAQSRFYFLNSLKLDPLTLIAISLSVAAVLARKQKRPIVVVAGVILYMLYTINIGGDFMSGRYFSAPLLACMALISTFEFKSVKAYGALVALTLIAGIAPIYLVAERALNFGVDDEGKHRIFVEDTGISDERLVYSDLAFFTRLELNSVPASNYARDAWVYLPDQPRRIWMVGPLGLNGMTMGPNYHMVDLNALADPLMARMPLYDAGKWRIGHFRHMIPKGYEETLTSGENKIENKNIALYYDKLSIVTQGDLWSWERMIEIWKMNTGAYDYLLENITLEDAIE